MRRQAAQGILAVLTAITVTAGLAVVLTGSAAPAAATVAKLPPSSLTWHAPVQVDGTGLGEAVAVTCPAPSFCASFDSAGYRATWNGSKWTAPVRILPPMPPGSDYDADGGTCASTTFCVVVGTAIWVESGGGLARTAPGTGNEGWLAVSCASPAFCVAGDNDGNLSVYNGHSWSTPVNVDENALTAISCASASFCDALDSDGSIITWNGTRWATTDPHLMTNGLAGDISCASAKFCMADDQMGYVWTFNGTAWSASGPTSMANELFYVSCTSSTFCLAAQAVTGDAAVYNGKAWSSPTAVLTYLDTAYVACSPGLPASPGSSGDCAVISDLGQANTLRSGRWTGQVSVDEASPVTAIACPTTSFCAAVGGNGDEIMYADGRWKAPVTLIPNGSFTSVSCPSARFCLAAGAAGSGALRMWRYNGTRWTPAAAPAGHPGTYWPTPVSCASAAFCVWTSPAGAISVWNGKTWTKPVRVDHAQAWLSVSCATASFCAAGDADGVATYNGKTWSGLRTLGVFNGNAQGVFSLSCTSPRFCAAALDVGAALFNGTTWAHTPASDNPSVTAVSCAKGGFCAAVGFPAGVPTAYTLDRGQWSSPVDVFTADGSFDPPVAISCATPEFCMATDSFGLVSAATRA
jgi:hypothetical protein